MSQDYTIYETWNHPNGKTESLPQCLFLPSQKYEYIQVRIEVHTQLIRVLVGFIQTDGQRTETETLLN